MLFLRIFVRAASLGDAVLMLKRVALNLNPFEIIHGMLFELGLSKADYAVMFTGIAVMLLMEIWMERGRDAFKSYDSAPAVLQCAGLLLMLGFITVFGLYSGNAASAGFIYGQY
jgi:hypothetical protein